MQETEQNRELISALVDGQLRGEEFARTVEWLGEEDDARRTWATYHVVGEVLRSGRAVTHDRDAAFMQRLKLGLQAERASSAPRLVQDVLAPEVTAKHPDSAPQVHADSANAPRFRWKLLAGVASLATVSLIGWQVMLSGVAQHDTPPLVQVPLPINVAEMSGTPALAGAEPAVMIRDPQLDALLVAHRQFGGTSALQMPAGFLRNATFEGAAR